MQQTTYSIPALARRLQADPRRLGRALDGVAADEITRTGAKRWLLATAENALLRHGHSLTGSGVPRTNGDGRGNGSNGRSLDRTLDDLELVAQQLEDAFAQLEAERDLEKRRAMAKHVLGPSLSAFEAALAANAAALPSHVAALTQAARDRMFGEAVSHAMAVLHLRLAA